MTKRFPGVLANDDVTFEVRSGEIHALLGENGAGKSTLMSVLCGLYRPDTGQIFLGRDGDLEPQEISSPRRAIELGIGMVHQHFKLVRNQSVTENILIGLEGVPFRLDIKSRYDQVSDLAERYGMPVDPRAQIWQLSVGEQQRVEILKMLYRGTNILILDEPTAVLTPQEATDLARTLRTMASEGKSIVFISHKLDEVMNLADRVTVLRAGRNVTTVDVGETSKQELARLMVGRELKASATKSPPNLGGVSLSVESLGAIGDRGLPALTDVSLQVHSGEILGIAGVAGNGQRELAETLTGLRSATSGSVVVNGHDITNQRPRRIIDYGVSHVPGDRLGFGMAANLALSDNLAMKMYRRRPLSRGLFLRKKEVIDHARGLIDGYDVSTPTATTAARNLSGGNQQKAILAREISAAGKLSGADEPPVLITAYPSRGLDVGAIEAVHARILEQRASGAAVLLISEDLEELMRLSDRIGVLHGGKIMGTVDAGTTDAEELGLMMAGEARAAE